MRIYWIDELDTGKLGIMARPRGNEWLEDEIQKLSLLGIDSVLSLLEKSEISELEIEKEGELCVKYEIGFTNFPIKDRSTPADTTAFRKLIEHLCQEVEEDKKIVVHCRMGIGRASLVAAGILLKKGTDKNRIFQLISQYRGMKVPDTPQQAKWIKSLELGQ